MARPVVVVHGGAGSPRTPVDEGRLRAGVAAALDSGWAVAAQGGSALDAAQAAVLCLEDDPAYNAGVGSVLTTAGTVEMDAAVACGRTGRVGAVAAITGVRNPVEVARAVMERSPHALLAGAGAEQFAADIGFEAVGPEHHLTPHQSDRYAPGTVGAVVLDSNGSLAAATSTGGVFGKLPGRVGDSPLFGAGTYADAKVAVSASGDGEAIMCALVAADVARLVRYRGLSLAEAAGRALEALTGEAGLITLDAGGAVAMPFSAGIFSRGVMRGDGPALTAVGPGEPAALGQ